MTHPADTSRTDTPCAFADSRWLRGLPAPEVAAEAVGTRRFHMAALLHNPPLVDDHQPVHGGNGDALDLEARRVGYIGHRLRLGDGVHTVSAVPLDE